MNQLEQYSTHQQMLVKAVLNTGGTVIELGSGWYSTPILSEICKSQRRTLFTFDSNMEWLSQFTHLASSLHIFELLHDWKYLVNQMACGAVFIDMAPGSEREYAVDKFRHNADVLVLHDTENQVEYGWQRVLPTFEYQYTDKTQPTWTTVCSDKIDVREWL